LNSVAGATYKLVSSVVTAGGFVVAQDGYLQVLGAEPVTTADFQTGPTVSSEPTDTVVPPQ
jgi:hypothetical protein